MKKFTRLAFIVLSAVLTLTSFSGCFGSKKKAGELSIWWPGGSDAEKAAIYLAKEKYEEAHPEVTIKIVEKATSNFYMDYMIATNGADYPDITYVDHVYVQQLAYEGIIANLSEEDSEIETTIKGKVIDSLWGVNSFEGDTYALPVSANTMAMVYNKKILREAYENDGQTWSEDKVPTTYNELLRDLALIQKYNTDKGLGVADRYVPYTVPSGSGDNNNSMASLSFLSFVAREGGKIISDDLKTMMLDTDEVLAAATKIHELGKANYSTAIFEEGRFESGRVGFIEMGPWKMQTYKLLTDQNPNCDFGWAPLVKFSESGKNTSSLGLFSMVATAKSINLDIAIDFMKFFVQDDELILTHNTPQNLIAPTKSAIANDFYKQDIWDVYVEQIDQVVARPGSPDWSTMEIKIGEFVTAMLAGSRTPDYLNSLNYVLQVGLDELYS